MKYSIVAKQNLNNESRLDAEFFAPEIIQAENCIAKHKNDEIARIANVIHPTEIERIYSDAGIQILLAQNVRNNCLCFDIKSYMPEEKKRLLSSNLLNYNDVLVTRTGANFGQAASYKSTEEIYACADLLVVKCNKILGGYLSTFFNTKYGRLMLDRGVYGAAQPHISSLYLKQLKVPRFNNVFEEMIDKLLNKSHSYTREINACYENTYKIFVNELGIKNWQPKHELSYVKNFSDVSISNRYDAEYFQPKYDEILEIINKNNHTTLIEQFDIIRNSGLEYDSEGKNGVIKTKQLKECFIDFNVEDRTNQGDSNILVKNQDVLFASMGVGSLGKANIYYDFEDNDKYIIDSTLKIFRAKKGSKISPEYLDVYLHSQLAQELIYQNIVGSSGIISIYESYLQSLPIPIINRKAEEKIIANVHNAHLFNFQSKQLLEIAKRGVEIAIEENEEVATIWIHEQLSKIGVTI